MNKRNPDKENRDLERAALAGDEAAAMKLYLNLLREDKIQPSPKIYYRIPYEKEYLFLDDGQIINSEFIEIEFFNPKDIQDLSTLTSEEFPMIVASLIFLKRAHKYASIAFIWKNKQLSTLFEYPGKDEQKIIKVVKNWGKTHQKEIENAHLAALHHKLFMFHQAYQRTLEFLRKDEKNLTNSIIEVLQTEDAMHHRRNPEENIRSLQRQWEATNDPTIAYKLVIEYRRRNEYSPLEILDAATPLLIANQPPMDFRDCLQERIRLGVRGRRQHNRVFDVIKFNPWPGFNPIQLSIQASAFHFCEPQITLEDLSLYIDWEVMGYSSNESPELHDMPHSIYFNEFEPIAHNMPTAYVQELFDWFRARFGLLN